MTSAKAGPTENKPENGADTTASGKVAVVKKYANRRLYNTATSSYVTLDELAQMVRNGEEFVVYDAKTNDDITRSVLTQIILEEDSKGRNLLPIKFLRQLIGFYDDSLHAFLPRYLELSMENFARHQHQMRGYMQETFGRFFPLAQFEEMTRQNMALFRQATSMFQPFVPGSTPGSGEGTPHRPSPSGTAEVDMDDLKAKLEALQRQLDQLNAVSSGPKKE
jgi:polyhydroxyalkanoate synthesis repressor PhaR